MFSKHRILDLISRINKIESEIVTRKDNPKFDSLAWENYLNRLYAEFNSYTDKLYKFATLKSGRVQIAVLAQIDNYHNMLH